MTGAGHLVARCPVQTAKWVAPGHGGRVKPWALSLRGERPDGEEERLGIGPGRAEWGHLTARRGEATLPSSGCPCPLPHLSSYPPGWWPCRVGLPGSVAQRPHLHTQLLLGQEGVASLLWRPSRAGGEEPGSEGCIHIGDVPHGAAWQRERMAGQAGLWLSLLQA